MGWVEAVRCHPPLAHAEGHAPLLRQSVVLAKPHRVATGGAKQHSLSGDDSSGTRAHSTVAPSTSNPTRDALVKVRWRGDDELPAAAAAVVAEEPTRHRVAPSLTARVMVLSTTALTRTPLLFMNPTSASQGYTTFLGHWHAANTQHHTQ